MQTLNEWIEYFRKMGFDIFFLITGMSGYFVTLKKEKKSIWRHLIDMLSGGLSAMFITPLFTDILRVNHSGELALAFGIGMMGHKAADLLVNFIKTKVNGKIKSEGE